MSLTATAQPYPKIPALSLHQNERQYSQEDIDFIAAYVAPRQAWYVIPIEALYPSGKNKRTGAFYESYREAWDLLKQPADTKTTPLKISEALPISSGMTNPISSAHTGNTNEASQPARQPQPQTAAPKSGSLPQDKVTLKSSDADHDGDSK